MNCIGIDDNPVALAALKNLIKQVDYLTLKGTYTNAVKAISAIERETIDLIFLDIEMPDINGMELIDTLQNPPLIIIVTTQNQYALAAFEKHVIDFLVKPVALPRFLSAVNFARKVHSSRKVKDEVATFIFVKSDNKWHKLAIADILYLQAKGDYIRIFTTDDNYMVHKTLKAVMDTLPSEQFVQVHRSNIINIARIDNIEDHSILMGKTIIPISERYKAEFMKKLNLL